MSWDNCVASIRQTFDKNAKEVLQVNWASIPQEDLDGNTFRTGNPYYLICPGRHCLDNVNITPVAHRICKCEDINGHVIPDCTPKDYLYPYPASICVNVKKPSDASGWAKSGRNCTRLGPDYYEFTCVCCCSCFANGTLIAAPAGCRRIEDFAVGDNVLAGSVAGSAGALRLSWEPLRVGFSFGTSEGGGGSEMVYLHYGSEGTIVVTTDHLFLLATGRVIRADRLVPGMHELVSPDGDAVALHEVSLGVYTGGVHHIATSPEFTGDLQKHLLSSAGVVSGDFNLQIHAAELADRVFVDGHDELPKLGSSAYDDASPDLAKTHTATYAAGSAESQPKPLQFYVYQPKAHRIPDGAAGYLTESQSSDVAEAELNVAFEEIPVSTHRATQVLKLFAGHYPAIVFKLLRGHMDVNAYAYDEDGQEFVTLTQGLIRLHGMDQEGMGLILAHLITRLQRSEPTDTGGWTSVGMADYFSTAITRDVYFVEAGASFAAGLAQVQAVLFDHITEGNDNFETDPFAPTTRTRVDALNAGFGAGYPPPGIGGPTQNGLRVLKAVARSPQFDGSSFVSRSIGADAARGAFSALVEHDIVAADGTLRAPVSYETDLSFLFPAEAEPGRQRMIASVRYVLIEGPHTVAVSFNTGISPNSVGADDFAFSPAARVVTTAPTAGASDTVRVGAQLDAGTQYAVTVDDRILASDGSTLDPDHASAQFSTPAGAPPPGDGDGDGSQPAG